MATPSGQPAGPGHGGPVTDRAAHGIPPVEAPVVEDDRDDHLVSSGEQVGDERSGRWLIGERLVGGDAGPSGTSGSTAAETALPAASEVEVRGERGPSAAPEVTQVTLGGRTHHGILAGPDRRLIRPS